MKLKTLRVTNFRSVEDSSQFEVGPTTCLVGKNEAGKSAILLALAALNPHDATPATLDKERDYPRRYLTQYDSRHAGEQAVAVETTWSLEPTDIAAVEAAVGEGVLADEEVTFRRRYGGNIELDTPGIDYGRAIANLYDRFGVDASERQVLGEFQSSDALIKGLAALETVTPRLAQLTAHLTAAGNVSSQVRGALRARLPKFMYFSSYDRMEGAVQVEQVSSLIANGQIDDDRYRGIRLFSEFLDYAGVSIDEIVAVTTYETFNARLQAASNNITDQILEYWTQNPDLNVIVRIEQARPGDPAPMNAGTIARARVENQLHRVDTPFSERSAGFVWFFSFLVKFEQVKDEGAPVVLLLDEPGLTLHGKAQADLLRFFRERLQPHHQIIYSTHSPFMVPADNLASVRVVEDRVVMKGPRRTPAGTKVHADVLSNDPDTVFPLQGALGYEITQSLFVGQNTLLVEGPGDILYLQSLSEALRRRDRKGLDARWTLCPAGGIDKIRPFVSLFVGNDLNVAVLSDMASGDRRKVDEIRKSNVLKAGHLYTMADFLERAEADIEDVFEPETFAEIVNGTYGLTGERKLDAASLKAAGGGTERLVKQADAAFAVMPPEVPEFDHFTPAAWLLRNPKLLEGKSAHVLRSLERAERIFASFNALL